MDSYLTIAEGVLRTTRRPLSAREIIEIAYATKAVPSQLFGKTQHKTLGARVSEDILLRRERSAFFRTEPGRFFLREFLTDDSIPAKYRIPIVARRREREIQRGRLISVSAEALPTPSSVGRVDRTPVLQTLNTHQFKYLNHPGERLRSDLMLWSFVMVRRGADVLTYRHGRYREGRDAFLQRRSVGFFTPVVDIDHDLFDRGDQGVVSSGVRAVTLDLDLPRTTDLESEYQGAASLETFLVHVSPEGSGDLLGLVIFDCPSWFEPLTRRLAINELAWMRLDVPVNHLEDFDPWSQLVLNQKPANQASKSASI